MGLSPWINFAIAGIAVIGTRAWAAVPAYSISATISYGGTAYIPAGAISNSGVLVQSGTNPTQYAILNQEGNLQPITTDPGVAFLPQVINNAGTALGFLQSINGSYSGQPAVWQNGNLSVLSPLQSDSIAQAWGINDSNKVVGQSVTASVTLSRAVVWQNGTAEDLSSLLPSGAASSSATAINNAGQIVVNTFDMLTHTNGQSYLLNDTQLVAIDPPGASANVFGTAINDQAQVAGVTWSNSESTQAFLWSKGKMIIAAPLFSDGTSDNQPVAINSSGIIIGNTITSYGISAPFVWDGISELQNLNDLIPSGSGWNLQSVDAINDQGDIVGIGVYEGIESEFILTPDEATGTTVVGTPEPTTLCLLAAEAMLLPLRRRIF